MRTITICFSRPKNKKFPIISWIIRAYLGTKYSHVSYHFEAKKYNCTLVYEAIGSGIRFIEKENWLKESEVIDYVTIEVNDKIYDEMMLLCIKKAGLKYGYWQNIGIVISDILKLNKNIFTSNHNCSELVAKILEKAGFEFNKSYDLITPKDIYNSIKNTTGVKIT